MKITLCQGFERVYKRILDRLGRPVPSGLASLGDQLFNGLNRRLHMLVTKSDGAQHDILRELFGFGLNHQDSCLGPCHHQIERSEERRVGKERRYRSSAERKRKE